jgi:GNAT superfamily N-acetyltransferase
MKVELASSAHREGLLELMQTASSGCYCRFWHFRGIDLDWQERCNLRPADNRAELEAALAAGAPEARGVVAVEGDRLLGWLKLCPADAMPKLLERRVYRSLPALRGDRSGVWLVGCLLVHADARRRGVARALVAGAVEAARALGARAVEAVPRRSTEPLRDDELWLGPPSVFERAGFVRVDGPDPYPLLRLELADAPDPR